jgi:hypothetical protein
VFVRMGSFEVDLANAEVAASIFKTTVVPQNSAVDGFVGAFACIDRTTGRFLGATLWRDAEAMAASDQLALRLAGEAKAATRMPTPRVERYEVVYADLAGLADAPEA